LSIAGKSCPQTLWKRRYRARIRRAADPAKFYLRRHKRKLKRKARIEATIDTLINEFAEAWTHSQGIGHPKYGAP
jgi:hypothetical protein